MPVLHFRNPHSVFPDDADDFDAYEDGNYIDEEIETSEQNGKRRRQTLRLLLRALLTVGIIGAVIFLFTWLASQRVYSSASYQTIVDMTPTDDTQYLSFGSHIVYYSQDGASCLNGSGSTIWSISYEMQRPLVSTAGNMLAICDYNGSKIYLQDSDHSIGTIDTSLPIRDLCVSESGETAAILADTDVTWVYLYDSSGNPIAWFKTTMSQSGYPISVAVSPNGELVCVSHLITDSTGVHSSMAFYNFGDVGQNVAENNVSGFNYDNEIFPFTKYMTDSSCVAVSDSRIAWFTGNQIPQNGPNAMFSDELQGVYSNDDYIGLLFPDTTGGGLYSLRIYDVNGNLTGTIAVGRVYTGIQIAGNCVYLNDNSNLVIDTVQGQQRYSGVFPMNVTAVIPRADTSNRIYLVTETGIEEMRLQ